jgi:tetratricopeptide (TPR) repeat protein
MNRRTILSLSAALLAATLLNTPDAVAQSAAGGNFDADLLTIQQDWAKANYAIADSDQKEAAFEALNKRAEAFAQANPKRAEALIWQGIVLSSYAGAKGGLGALGIVKQSRAKLEQALKIDPNALEGSAYTSLGTLYYKVPGFPIGFGDDKKAQRHLEAALKINPTGIDPNYFYGEFLFEDGRYADAIVYLNKALAAPPRPNRELADKGRRGEIEALLAKAKQKAN